MKQQRKKFKLSTESDISAEGSLKMLLKEINDSIIKKLESIEERLDLLEEKFDVLEGKLEMISYLFKKSEYNFSMAPPISSKVAFIALNSEGNYPYGSWLGDPNNPECRVRCHILPSELLHINDSCNTAEKMALTLLDYLFNRETLACSNISGMGKHKKKQLDPLLIHGIKCHLSVHFNITEKDWSKIKQNIDSKCRAAFRRLKGLCVESKDETGSTKNDYSLNNVTAEVNDSMTQDSVSTCEPDCVILKEEVIL